MGNSGGQGPPRAVAPSGGGLWVITRKVFKSHPITDPFKSNNKYPITKIVISNMKSVSQNI